MLPLTLHIRPRTSMVMPRPKTTSLRRTKKNLAVGGRVLVLMPGVTGFNSWLWMSTLPDCLERALSSEALHTPRSSSISCT